MSLRALIAVAGIVASSVPSAATAAPLPAPTGLKAVTSTASTMTFRWDAVPDAPAYRITISANRSLEGAAERVTTTNAIEYPKLKPQRRYYAVVRVVSAKNAELSAASAMAAGTTRAAPPPLPIPADPRLVLNKPSGILLQWDAVAGAVNYRLRVAHTASMADRAELTFPTPRATVFGVPHLRRFFVQVLAVDAAGQPVSRWSKAVGFTTAKAYAAPKKPALTIASFNVRCANCYSAMNQEKPWTTRRAVVVSQIISRRPDVIGIQEASQAKLKGTDVAQFEDLGARLRAAGVKYQITNADRKASQGTRLFYNTATVQLLSQGVKLLPSCSGCNTRHAAWGIFKQKATGEAFFVATTHTQWMAKYAKLRLQEIQVMMDEIATRNPKKLPTFVTGDFNSTRYQSPSNAPYDEVIKRGFVDPLGHTPKSAVVSPLATAETRIRAQYNSHNNFLRSVAKFAEWQNGSNLDYILTTPMRVLLWETVLDLDKKDQLVGTIPSDHNMVLIKAVLP